MLSDGNNNSFEIDSDKIHRSAFTRASTTSKLATNQPATQSKQIKYFYYTRIDAKMRKTLKFFVIFLAKFK